MEEKLKDWVKTFYSGSDRAGKVELKTFNDKYSLCYLKGTTGYVNRMSGNAYSSSQWFICENFAELEKMWRIPTKLFTVDGRLTQEDKNEIALRFDLEVPKQQRKKVDKPVDKWLIAFDRDAFFGGGFSSPLYCQKIIKEEDNKFTTFSVSKDKNVIFNKNKYKCLVVDIDDLQNICQEIQDKIKDYNKTYSELSNKKAELLKYFEN